MKANTQMGRWLGKIRKMSVNMHGLKNRLQFETNSRQ